MNITKPKFLEALSVLAPLCKVTRTTLPVLSMVKIDGAIMSASNLDEYATVRLEGTGELEPCCVSLDMLQRFARIASDQITLSNEKTLLVIQSLNGSARLSTLPAGEHVTLPDGKLRKIGVNCVDLADCIERVAWAAAPSTDTRFVLIAVHVALTDEAITVQASNGKCIARASKPSIAAPAEFLIPILSVPSLMAALRTDGAVLSLGENHVSVEHSAGQYWARLVDGQFPRTEPILEAKRNDIGKLKAPEWLALVKSAALLQSPIKWHHAVLKLDGAGGSLSFKNATGERYNAVIQGEFPELALAVNLEQWSDMLSSFDDCEVSLSHDDGSLAMKNGELTVIASKTFLPTD